MLTVVPLGTVVELEAPPAAVAPLTVRETVGATSLIVKVTVPCAELATLL